jgi:glycosyltransferase involved in cell wall biosynthesis
VSHFGKAQAMRITPPGDWSKFHLVRCGLELDALPPVTGDAQQPQPGGTIICVGRLSPEKAQSGLIDAFATLAARHPGWRLVLVGDGPDRQALEQQVERSGLGDRVEFVGRLPERATLVAIARSDLLVLPSFMEGLPVVLMEAMALGVPVVSSNVAGIPELIDHGTTGLLFPASDWNALSAAIERMITDPAQGRQMAAMAKQRIAAEFDINRAVVPLAARFGFTSA